MSENLLAAAPALLVLAVVILIAARIVLRVPFVGIFLVIALALPLALFGMASAGPASNHAWGPGPLYLLLLWLTLGVAGGAFILALTSSEAEKSARVSFGILSGAFLLGLGAARWNEQVVAPVTRRDDVQFWEGVFKLQQPEMPVEEYRKHGSQHGLSHARILIHQNRDLSPEMLKMLAKVMPDGLAVIDQQTRIDQELIQMVLEESAKETERGNGPGNLPILARNPNVPDEILLTLVNHPNADVRDGLARNSGASIATLEALLADTELRRASGRYHYTETQNLFRQAKTRMAEHPDLAPERLSELAEDPDEHIRAGATRNSMASRQLLEQLRNDPVGWVRQGAERRLKDGKWAKPRDE